MSRLTLALAVLVGILGGGLGVSLFMRQSPDTATVEAMVSGMLDDQQPLSAGAVRTIATEVVTEQQATLAAATPPVVPVDDQAVRTIVTSMLDERDAARPMPGQPAMGQTAMLNQEQINPMIEAYLMSNPKILQQVSAALDTQLKLEEGEHARVAIASMKSEIFDDPDHIVIGNPNGDVTLVEMFDYNCTYCRGALPDLATLIAEDPNLRVVLKEFPILSNESVEAARVAVLVGKSNVDYWTFHEALFTSRGQVTAETALAEAQKLGLNRIDLELQMKGQPVTAVLDKSYAIARALDITGTPSYIIGDEIIPGAIGVDQLRMRIQNMRACGKTSCEG